MSQESQNTPNENDFLTTKEAAQLMGVSQGTVRDLCKANVLAHAYRERSEPYQISKKSVEEWQRHNNRNTHWESICHHWRSVVATIIAVTGVILTWIAISSDVIVNSISIYDHFAPVWLGRVRPANENEILILISPFYLADNMNSSEPHSEIQRALDIKFGELTIENARIGLLPDTLSIEGRSDAERLGNKYNASIVIWGAETNVRVTVNFINLRFKFIEIDSTISETERAYATTSTNPNPYVEMITHDLPQQFTFLSLFTVSQYYYLQNDTERAIAVLDNAIEELEKVSVPAIEARIKLDSFYYAGLYRHKVGRYEEAIDFYSKVIESGETDANQVSAYVSRGNAYQALNKCNLALDDYGKAMKFEANNINTDYNRGVLVMSCFNKRPVQQSVDNFPTHHTAPTTPANPPSTPPATD